MSNASNPVPSRSEKAKTGIYIARGADTLGPYNPEEAAALVLGGYLQMDDHAAHNGDSVWVPLADFLPVSFHERRASAPPAPTPTPPAAPPRWQGLAVAILGLVTVPFLVAGGTRWFEGRQAVNPPPVRATPTPVPEQTPAPTPVPTPAPTASAVPVVESLPTAPPTPEPDGPLRGALDAPLAGVWIAAYPLDTLETALAPVRDATKTARDRLDPLVDAAAAELATRTTEEGAALRALNEAAPSDPLLRSLRFAYNGARTATRTAADNHRFLLEERATAAGGEVFFRALPATATAETETDAAGAFTLDLPPDSQPYAVAASLREKADDGTVRTRRWLVRLTTPQRTGHAPLRLDGGNDLTSPSEDSLARAVD